MKIRTQVLNYGRAYRSDLCTPSGSVIVSGPEASSERVALICLRAEVSRWAEKARAFVQEGIESASPID
jgi:hypothetical protein